MRPAAYVALVGVALACMATTTATAQRPPDQVSRGSGRLPSINLVLDPKEKDGGGGGGDTGTNLSPGGNIQPGAKVPSLSLVLDPKEKDDGVRNVDLSVNANDFNLVPSGRDYGVQIMIVVRISTSGPVRITIGEIAVQPPRPEPRSLLGAIRGLIGSRRPLSPVTTMTRATATGARSSLSNLAPVAPPPRRQAERSGVQVFLTNVGSSTGEAFQMHVFNNGPSPVNLSGEGLVVEPLKEKAAEQVREQLQGQLARLGGSSPFTASLDAYCLEFLRAPPQAGQLYQIASHELQQRYEPLKKVLSAGQRLHEMGLLRPDSDPTNYFHSIRQWAVWTIEQEFDQASFANAFVEHTKKNIEAAGRDWTKQIEEIVRGAAPNRWNDIGKVLEAAGVTTR